MRVMFQKLSGFSLVLRWRWLGCEYDCEYFGTKSAHIRGRYNHWFYLTLLKLWRTLGSLYMRTSSKLSTSGLRTWRFIVLPNMLLLKACHANMAICCGIVGISWNMHIRWFLCVNVLCDLWVRGRIHWRHGSCGKTKLLHALKPAISQT